MEKCQNRLLFQSKYEIWRYIIAACFKIVATGASIMLQPVPNFILSIIKQSIWPISPFFDSRQSHGPTKTFQQDYFIIHLMSKFRRFCLFHLTRKYIIEQLALRKGTCR